MGRHGTIGFEYAPDAFIVGLSPAMQEVFARIERYASSAAPVLITGPTGTGKELVARALHNHSGRKGRFAAVNCACVSESLFESEFFGHKRGAFTGAHADRQGWFEQAAGGTLFLDEVGEMPASQQAKLLRALQERSVTPVGAAHAIPVSARIVAATNIDLEGGVASGRFREDLLDRLNVLPIRMPPLAERPGDFPMLVEHLLRKANTEEGANVEPPHGESLRAMELALGNGSIRVLANLVRRLVLAKRCGRIGVEDLREAGLHDPADVPAGVESAISHSGRERRNAAVAHAGAGHFVQIGHPPRREGPHGSRPPTTQGPRLHGDAGPPGDEEVWYRVRGG